MASALILSISNSTISSDPPTCFRRNYSLLATSVDILLQSLLAHSRR
jgi:hypothetical protein